MILLLDNALFMNHRLHCRMNALKMNMCSGCIFYGKYIPNLEELKPTFFNTNIVVM